MLLAADPVKSLGRETVLNGELAAFVTDALARQADRALFSAPGLSWPTGLIFPAQKPRLPAPRIKWGRSSGPPTFPATYPAVASPAVEDLLRKLGAVDTVE